MKNTIFIALILLAGILTSCGSVKYFGIETFTPAEITFPETVETVVIVNNAVPQPKKPGYKYTIMGVEQDTTHMVADSALYDACEALGEAIADQPFFKDVRLYNDAVRQDEFFFQDTKLTPDQVETICDESGAEAIISLDRLLFNMEKDVFPFGEVMAGTIKVQATAVLRAYMPGRNNSMATIYLTDSLFWSEGASNLRTLDSYLPKPEVALRETAAYLTSGAYRNFVPHWEQAQRWYYTNSGTRWKQASAFASKEKWEEALTIWQSIYEAQTNKKSKAEAAANIAVGYEMVGKFNEALDWAKKSLALFKEQTSDEKDSNVALLTLYEQVITSRIQANNKLNMQFGKE